AEDGIRDRNVTGVQTCALPISFKEQVRRRREGKIDAADETLFSGEVLTGRMALARGLIDGIGDLRSVMRARFGDTVRLVSIATRSEERRVGKEGRSRWSAASSR